MLNDEEGSSFLPKKKSELKLPLPSRDDPGVIRHKFPEGFCLICQEWFGVNDHKHHPKEEATTHYHFAGNPQTPHIIVSPDEGDLSPAVSCADDSEEENAGIETGVPATVTAQNRHVDQTDGTSGNHSLLADAEDRTGNVEVQLKEGDQETTRNVPLFTPQKEVVNSDGENDCNSSSTEHSPIEDQLQPYYFNRREDQTNNKLQREYLTKGYHNEQNSFQSFDVTLDPFMRKTRRNSMIGIMRRVSSQTNVGGGFGSASPQMGRSTSRISILPNSLDWIAEMNETFILCVSALYGKLLVVLGMAFPIAEMISNHVPLIFYNGFYLYLYFVSIMFLIYAYLFLLREKSLPTESLKIKIDYVKRKFKKIEENLSEVGSRATTKLQKSSQKETNQRTGEKDEGLSINTSSYKPNYTMTITNNHGSMYLKMGAVLFGIGSMIYSGLNFGQYFELRPDKDCANILMAITPVARMLFTFLQMYFIFLNSRVAISKHTIIARFGFMHMIGTNLCIWLYVLVQETKHEIAHLTSQSIPTELHHSTATIASILDNANISHDHDDDHQPETNHLGSTTDIIDSLYNMTSGNEDNHHNVEKRSTPAHDNLLGCRRINLMGHVITNASPFLYPCTVEYSLLCAGVIYVMWKNISVRPERVGGDGDSDISTFIARKVRHHYSVDCARASRGLFMGIFILVLTIISLILFYVLVSNDQFMEFAILEANIVELSIYGLATVAVIYGMKQMRELEFIREGDIELDNILLIVAEAGVYIYTSFTIIGGYFNMEESRTLPLVTSLVILIQTTLQTLFILDGSRRCCYTADQLDRKPGREIVTFLLVCNLALWAISTFETSRADVHPVQLHFYGIWAWTIISHVSMPLGIFYRFHATVCLGEIWKRSYKLRHEFMSM